MVPFSVGYHLAHHVDMTVPYRNLPRLHRALVADGYLGKFGVADLPVAVAGAAGRLSLDAGAAYWRPVAHIWTTPCTSRFW
ncbi:MAG: hypothetical protein Ct9H300mP12_07080 [Acidimicrobiales bacterium]|nr:MAG: hypothetical protein Ct9H300mP12_07080 [Acidimicrobiales bacterium]